MSDSANVRSVEAIERLRVTVLEFAASCQDGLDEMDQVMRRVVDWLEHDRPRYWKEAIRERQRQLHEARQQLARCLMFSLQDERPACREERGAVRQAEAAVSEGESKAQRVRHYRQLIQQEMFEFEGRLGHFAAVLANDVPRAAATLARIIQEIEHYRQTQAPGRMTSLRPPAARDGHGSKVGGAGRTTPAGMASGDSSEDLNTATDNRDTEGTRDRVPPRGGEQDTNLDHDGSSDDG